MSIFLNGKGSGDVIQIREGTTCLLLDLYISQVLEMILKKRCIKRKINLTITTKRRFISCIVSSLYGPNYQVHGT